MTKHRKTVILISILAGLTMASLVLAYRQLEVSYPQMPSIVTPSTVKTSLPEYIKYVFSFSLLCIGLVILGSLLQGGFRYLVSVGNPDKMKDSREQMISAFTGGLMLLGAYILLNTINPELVVLRIPGITPATTELKIFNSTGGGGDPMVLARSEPDLSSFGKICWPPPANCGGRSLSYNGVSPEDVDVTIYASTDYSGTQVKITSGNSGSFPFVAKSIKIGWKPPGVYLFSRTNFDINNKWKNLQYSSSVLFDFDDMTQSIMFKNRAGESPYGAVLHQDKNFQGLCGIFLSNNMGGVSGDWPNLNQSGGKYGEIRNNEASSITVFKINEGSAGGQVKLTGKGSSICNSPVGVGDRSLTLSGFTKASWGNLPFSGQQMCIGADGGGWVYENTVNSVEINGDYLVILFENPSYGGRCEIFTHSDDDLSNNPVGRCSTLPAGITCPSIPILNWQAPCLSSCVSSFMVIPTAP